jgi:hypothetical protein
MFAAAVQITFSVSWHALATSGMAYSSLNKVPIVRAAMRLPGAWCGGLKTTSPHGRIITHNKRAIVGSKLYCVIAKAYTTPWKV